MGERRRDALAEIASLIFVHECSYSQLRNCHYPQGETSAKCAPEPLFSQRMAGNPPLPCVEIGV
jgi:hypothetical protein